MKPPSRHPFRPYLLTWVGLMALLGLEILVTRGLKIYGAAPFFGIAMATVVAFMFMNLRSASNLSRIFAVAMVVWLTIMMTLGVLDPLTRTIAVVAPTTPLAKP